MSQTVLIEEDGDLGRMFSLNLNIFVGTDVIWKGSSQDAIDLLKVHPTVDLIICQAHIGEKAAAIEIYEYLLKEGRSIPLIVMGEDDQLGRDVKLVEKVPQVKDLVSHAAKILGITAQDMLTRPVPELYPIPISAIVEMGEAVCDIYLKLKKSDRPDHFVKRFKKGDGISKGALFRYIAYGETNMYVPSPERIHFVQSFTEQMLAKLKGDDLELGERTKLNGECMELAAKKIRTLGMTPETATIIDASIQSIMTTVKMAPSLEVLFQQLLSDKAGFLYKHCQLCVFISTHILRNLNWGTSNHILKMGVVCFFHDLLLPSEKLARIRDDHELEESSLNPDEKILVQKHAQFAGELIKKYPTEHLDAEIIIRQHHGAFGGHGFVEKFPANISPLAMIFIVAEDFTHRILDAYDKGYEKGVDKEAVISEMREKYRPTKYQQILDALSSIEF